jgi:hypothetical protein
MNRKKLAELLRLYAVQLKLNGLTLSASTVGNILNGTSFPRCKQTGVFLDDLVTGGSGTKGISSRGGSDTVSVTLKETTTVSYAKAVIFICYLYWILC